MNRRSPIARSFVVAGALVVACTLSSCGAVDTNNDVAVVDGQGLSQDDLQAMLESTLGQEVLETEVIDGQVDSQSARSLITAWITQTVFREHGVGADADRVSIESQLASENAGSWDEAPQVMRDLYIDVLATNPVIDGGETDLATLRSMLRGADVSVDSRYGTWDPDRGGVVGFD